MDKTSTDKHAELFRAFLSESPVVIADPSSGSRVRLAKSLVELGAKRHQIRLTGSYEEAQNELQAFQPRIVLADFNMPGRSGLDLLQEHRSLFKDQQKGSVFALVTGNTSQAAVAQAAEEDVDTFILKPYTVETFKNSLVQSTLSKLYPSRYIKLIDEGKEALVRGDFSAAKTSFTSAKGLNPKPTLACFYLGQAELMSQALEGAENEFETGLSHSKIHYKCLVGLYELLMKQGKQEEAYGIVKRIAQYFPANPKRLASVLRLAIVTKNYEDIESYYRLFIQLEKRTDELIKYICSALAVTGKYYLSRSIQSRALTLFDSAAVSCAGRPTFLKYIVETLIESQMPTEARRYMERFPHGLRGGPEYLSLEAKLKAALIASS